MGGIRQPRALIAENDRDEQRKLIKYNHLVANCLIFYNAYAMTEALHRLVSEGLQIMDETLRCLSPYLTKHTNRFGDYKLDLEQQPPSLNYRLNVVPFKLTPPR